MHYSHPAFRAFVPAVLALCAAALPAGAATRHKAPSRRLAPHAAPKPQTAPVLPGWTLTFDDEFNTPRLDTDKWTATDWASTINSERQDYAPDDVSVSQGALHLMSRKRARGGREYTSGEVRSVGKFSQLYGRFEFRARLPKTQGTWSAEYLIAENDRWPPEIDVEEYLARMPNALHMTTHWADREGHHSSFHFERDDTDVDYTAWHIYAVEWEPGVVRWFIDGHLYATSDAGAKPNISHVPMYLRINTAVGGWGGDLDAGCVWPQLHDVDYVRVYRRTSAPPPANAGPDQELGFPERTAHLQGIACSPMGAHTATWSQVAGPAPAAFSQPHALATSVVFPMPGTYRLRFTVADGKAVGADDMTVLVNGAQAAIVLPAADAYTFVNSARVDLHADGGAPDLLIGARPSQDDAHDQMQSYLTFDLARVPHVSHASLRLYGGQIYTSYPEVLHCLVQAVPKPQWDEKSVLWADAPALGSQTAAFDVYPLVHNSTDHWYDIDVTPLVQAMQSAGQTTVGLALLPVLPGGIVFAAFHSHEDAAHAPHLLLTP